MTPRALPRSGIVALAVLTAVATAACSTTAQREYDEGAVPAFARDAIAGTSPVTVAAAPERGDPVVGDEEARLSEVAESWKRVARTGAVDPAQLGFDVGPAPAQDALRGELSPETLYAAVYAMSPAIDASRKALRATVEQFDQVAFLDTLLRQYTSFTKDLNLRFGAQRQKQRIERSFPFPAAGALKSQIVAEDAAAARERLAQTVRDTLAAAGTAYFDYAYVGEAIGIVEENVALLQGTVDVASSKYGVGAVRQGVVLRAQVEASKLEDQLVTLHEQLGTSRAKIASILGLPPDFPLGPPVAQTAVAPPESPDALYPVAQERRQEIRALEAKVRRTESLIELAETKAYPDLSLGTSRFEEGAATKVGGARMMEPFENPPRAMPSFWFGETASFVQEMRIRLTSMRAQLADLRARVGFDVQSAWFRWDAAWRQVQLHETSLLPQSRQAFEVTESGWREGGADFLDVLDAQRAFLRYRLESRGAVRDAGAARLALIVASGGPPQVADQEGR